MTTKRDSKGKARQDGPKPKERSGLKRPNDAVKDLEAPEDTGENVRGGSGKHIDKVEIHR